MKTNAASLQALAKLGFDEIDTQALSPDGFVIDGHRALRTANGNVFGEPTQEQRCRANKVRIDIEQLPKRVCATITNVTRAAYLLDINDGMGELRQRASWLRPATQALRGDCSNDWRRRSRSIERAVFSMMRCLCSAEHHRESNRCGAPCTPRVFRCRNAQMAVSGNASGSTPNSWRSTTCFVACGPTGISSSGWCIENKCRRHQLGKRGRPVTESAIPTFDSKQRTAHGQDEYGFGAAGKCIVTILLCNCRSTEGESLPRDCQVSRITRLGPLPRRRRAGGRDVPRIPQVVGTRKHCRDKPIPGHELP